MDSQDHTADIRKVVDLQTDEFELMLLACVDSLPPYYREVHHVLCINREGGFENDFSTPDRNALYRVIDFYYRHICDQAQPTPVDMNMARVLLTTLANDGDKGVNLEEIDGLLSSLFDLRQRNAAMSLGLVMQGFHYWLEKKRLMKALQSGTAYDDWDPGAVLQSAAMAAEAVRVTKNRTRFAFGEGIDNRTLNIDRYTTGLHNLDAALGGGAGRKEHILFIAPTGAGKTVMACQLSSAFAAGGLIGPLITTEQTHEELEPRMVSANCGIPFHQIKDGINPDHLSRDQHEKYTRWRRDVADGKIWIEDWAEDPSKSILSDIEQLILSYRRNYGQCDYVILDWIGGALGSHLSVNKTDQIRHLYQLTADAMSAMARKHNIITVSFAQAHPKLAGNTIKVDQGTISECKTMGRNATYIFGITAIEQADGNNENAAATYADQQYLYCSKGRKSPNTKVRIKRDFGFQRFVAA